MRYAKDIAGELKSRVVSAAHQDGVLKSDVDIYGIVELDEGEIRSGQDAKLTFTVDVMPEFELPSYDGLKESLSRRKRMMPRLIKCLIKC